MIRLAALGLFFFILALWSFNVDIATNASLFSQIAIHGFFGTMATAALVMFFTNGEL